MAPSELRPPRRWVAEPASTCPLIASAMHQAGLKLRLCDVRPSHFDMDPALLRDACDENMPAIILAHLSGRIADVDDAVATARDGGAHVIEAATQT